MIYRIGKWLFMVYYHLFFRLKVTGRENIPRQGGAILCANHISHQDPMVLAGVVKRQICFLGKKELFCNPFITWLFHQLGGIPVDREAVGVSTLKQVVALLQKGKVIGIFAQGTRVSEVDTKSAKAGVALFALKAGVPVIPVGIQSGYRFFSRIKINIGEPITLEEYRDARIKTEMLNSITEDIMARVKGLCE